MGDIVRGVERTRAWPRKRGKSKTEQQKQQTEAFRQAQWAYKYQDAEVQATIVDMVAETPLMPRDLFLMMASGRAFAFQSEGGPIQYSMASMQDVSESLDVITQTPGHGLVRGPQFWEGQALPSGPGAGFGWQLIDDKTITSPLANWDVSVAGFNDVACVGLALTSSSSGFRSVRASIDGGVSFLATSGNYVTFSTAGVGANIALIEIHSTAATAARYGIVNFRNCAASTGVKTWDRFAVGNNSIGFVPAAPTPINAIRWFNTAGNLTGGRMITLGR